MAEGSAVQELSERVIRRYQLRVQRSEIKPAGRKSGGQELEQGVARGEGRSSSREVNSSGPVPGEEAEESDGWGVKGWLREGMRLRRPMQKYKKGEKRSISARLKPAAVTLQRQTGRLQGKQEISLKLTRTHSKYFSSG